MTETQPVEVGGNPPDRIYEGVDQLAAALAAVQAELPKIVAAETAKVTGETKQGKPVSYSYKYAGLATVAGAVLPLLGKHSLSFTAWPTVTSAGRFMLRYELLHASGQRIIGFYPLNEDVRSPQAMGSQITYARRYCLCAVTGVSPDDDDDAAAAEAKVAAQRAAEQAEYDKEREDAIQKVMGAWSNHYGGWDADAAAQMFSAWSKGGTVAQASPAQLRAFTGMLLALPPEDAGSTPNADPAPPAEDGVREASPDKPMSRRDQAHMFVLFEKLGLKDDRQRQLEYLRAVLERDIQSRGDLLDADTPRVLKALKDDVEEAERSGMAPNQPSDGDS